MRGVRHLNKANVMVILLCALLCTGIKPAMAMQCVTLTARIPSQYPLYMDIGEHGALIIDDQVYTGDGLYQVQHGQSLTLLFQVDAHYKIQEVVLNAQDVSKQVQQGVFQIEKISGEMRLLVRFSPADTPPQTGDPGILWASVIAFLAALLLMVIHRHAQQDCSGLFLGDGLKHR